MTQKRTLSLGTAPQLRAEGEETPSIQGTGTTFNDEYELFRIGDWVFTERIAPGAVTKTLEESDDIMAMFNHSPDAILGRQSAGNLEVWADRSALHYKVSRSEDMDFDRVASKIRAGNVKGSSITFSPVKLDRKVDEEGKTEVTTITEMRLYELGPVAMPANPSTSAAMRSAVEQEFNLDALHQGLIKQSRGIPLTAAEFAEIRQIFDALQPEPQKHSERSAMPLEAAQALVASIQAGNAVAHLQ